MRGTESDHHIQLLQFNIDRIIVLDKENLYLLTQYLRTEGGEGREGGGRREGGREGEREKEEGGEKGRRTKASSVFLMMIISFITYQYS